MADTNKKQSGGGWLTYCLSFLELPFKIIFGIILNTLDYIIFKISVLLKGKKALVHDLRQEYEDDILAAPYFPSVDATEIKDRDEYFKTEGVSPIYRHLMSHTRSGALVKAESVLDELLPPKIRDRLFNAQEEQRSKVKKLLTDRAKKDRVENIQQSRFEDLDYPKDEIIAESSQRQVTETLIDFFESIFRKYAKKPCVGYRTLKKNHKKEVVVDGKTKTWITPEFNDEPIIYTYEQLEQKVTALSKAMQKCFNLESSAGDEDYFAYDDESETEKTRSSRFAIFDDTSYDWFVTALALFKQNVTLVTVYASLGSDALVEALNESKVSGVMINFSSLKEIVPRIAKECPKVKYILYNNRMCENSTEEIEQREKLLNELNQKYGNHVVLTTIEELIEMGMQEKSEFRIKGKPHSNTDIQILMYTSGSTSKPKAVMITHYNFLSAIASFNCCIGVEREEEYIHIAYLPLGHILEIVVHSVILLRGGQICYGNARFLSEGTALPCGDIKYWRPSVLVGVPKVFDTIKKGAQLTLHSVAEKRGPFLGWLVNTLFKMAYSAKKNALANGRDTPLWNKIIFKRFTDGVGGRLKLLLSGGSALIPETHEFLRICMNSVFIQGSGLTESCACTSVANAFQKFSPGHCGPFVPCVEIRLCDVPEMGMFHNNPKGGNPRGELWIRGDNISLGYYKQRELTLEAYGKLPNDKASNPFFKTGDVVELLPNGCIKIIDRVKNLTKLQHGEYIALNKLESIYGDSQYVQPNGILVYADSFRDYPVALAMPQTKYLESLAKDLGISYTKVEELFTNPQIIKTVLQSLDKIATNSKLNTSERIKNIYFCETEWTIENNMLTATQKLRRHAITEHYRAAIEKMYKP